jgi:hypothetical protein
VVTDWTIRSVTLAAGRGGRGDSTTRRAAGFLGMAGIVIL